MAAGTIGTDDIVIIYIIVSRVQKTNTLVSVMKHSV